MPGGMARVTVRAAVTLTLVGAFVAAIFTELDESAVAALAGPMGIAIGFYFHSNSG